MAYSLRQRLAKRTPLAEMKKAADNNSSSASSREPSPPAHTTKCKKDLNDEQPPIALDDLSTTPPPNRKLRSSKDFSLNKTPPKSLLEKYKGKAAKQVIPTASQVERKKSGATKATTASKSQMGHASIDGKAAHGKDQSPGSSPSPTKRDSELQQPLNEPTRTGETRKVNGVEFDMLHQSKSHTNTVRQGPSHGENHHRRTRSQSRREERASSTDTLLADDLKSLQLDTGLDPPPLSIRKVDRTPSPKIEEKEQKRDGLWDSALKLNNQQPQRSWLKVHNTRSTASTETSNPSPPPQPTHKRSPALDPKDVHNLVSFPPPPLPAPESSPAKAKSSPSPSPLSDEASTQTPPKLKKSILKNTHSPDSGNLSLTVCPPAPPTPGDLTASPAAIGFIFCSEKLSSSRPVEPWAWCKRWTCCTCASDIEGGDGGVGVGRGGKGGLGAGGAEWYEKPAVTMAEQKICSRVSCGHVRCTGCWMEREARFAGIGPFGR